MNKTASLAVLPRAGTVAGCSLTPGIPSAPPRRVPAHWPDRQSRRWRHGSEDGIADRLAAAFFTDPRCRR